MKTLKVIHFCVDCSYFDLNTPNNQMLLVILLKRCSVKVIKRSFYNFVDCSSLLNTRNIVRFNSASTDSILCLFSRISLFLGIFFPITYEEEKFKRERCLRLRYIQKLVLLHVVSNHYLNGPKHLKIRNTNVYDEQIHLPFYQEKSL